MSLRCWTAASAFCSCEVCRPFLSDKYDLTQHPNYKLTSDYDPKNTFDIEKYLNRKEKIHPADEFIVVDADSLPPA